MLGSGSCKGIIVQGFNSALRRVGNGNACLLLWAFGTLNVMRAG